MDLLWICKTQRGGGADPHFGAKMQACLMQPCDLMAQRHAKAAALLGILCLRRMVDIGKLLFVHARTVIRHRDNALFGVQLHHAVLPRGLQRVGDKIVDKALKQRLVPIDALPPASKRTRG